MPPLQLLVFDLDGTLIDSEADIVRSVNAALDHCGRPPLPSATIASYIGDGASTLIRRALREPDDDLHDPQLVARALTFFLDFYRVHKLDHTYLYPGVLGALETIRRDHPGLLMAVLTNKPVRPSRDICAHFGLDRFFFQNYGGNSFPTKKPEPLGLNTLIVEASELRSTLIAPESTLMIGDSSVDILTARNAGARSLGCTFGLAPDSLAAAQPDAIAQTPAEWPTIVANLMI